MGFFDNLTKSVRTALSNDVDLLMKGDENSVPDNALEVPDNKTAIGQKAIIDDPFYDQVNQHFLFKNKMSRLSHKMLKDASIRDWVVSAIIQARCDTMLRFSKPQRKPLDMGFKLQKKDFHGHLSPQEKEEIAMLEEFIVNCGRTDKLPAGDQMYFGEFLKLCTRDALTFGHIAVEKVLTRRGGLHRFRPVPSESMYIVNNTTNRNVIEKELEQAKITYKMKRFSAYNGNNPEVDQQYNEPDITYWKYVQMSYDNRVLSAFGDEDMIWHNFNVQNFADSNGYCLSPLEMAINTITNHLSVENYNALFFTHGQAARGVLHLKGTVTPASLTSFRRQFYNTINGTSNAWRTPIIAGLDDVQWISLSGTAKEMEYLNFNNHLMRAICSQFQMDPLEIGLDYLISATGRTSGQQANNEAKINYSRERGLIPILMMFEDMINSKILPALDKDLASRYEFKFTGYDDDSPQTHVAQLQAELTVAASMNDLLRSYNKETLLHPVGDLPLNQTFWGLVEKNMTKGEIRATFFGDKAAMEKRELSYFPGDPSFQTWTQFVLTLDRAKKQDEQTEKQMKQQQQQQDLAEKQANHQMTIEQGKHTREKEMHDLNMAQAQTRQAHASVSPSSLKDIAKQAGAATKPIDGMANPLNSDTADEV